MVLSAITAAKELPIQVIDALFRVIVLRTPASQPDYGVGLYPELETIRKGKAMSETSTSTSRP